MLFMGSGSDGEAEPWFQMDIYVIHRITIYILLLICSLPGNEIPAKDQCKLTCHDGFRPVWANVSTCLDDGYWDNYLDCIQKK